MEQYWSSLAKPRQSLPLYAGAGLLHSRVRKISPLPHVTEHVDHSLHSVKFPWTAKKTPTILRNSVSETSYQRVGAFVNVGKGGISGISGGVPNVPFRGGWGKDVQRPQISGGYSTVSSFLKQTVWPKSNFSIAMPECFTQKPRTFFFNWKTALTFLLGQSGFKHALASTAGPVQPAPVSSRQKRVLDSIPSPHETLQGAQPDHWV
jgi:hypothetical protein